MAEVGESTARVWGLYMAGSRLGFERNEIQLHQVLGVRVAENGDASFPLRPTWVTGSVALGEVFGVAEPDTEVARHRRP